MAEVLGGIAELRERVDRSSACTQEFVEAVRDLALRVHRLSGRFRRHLDGRNAVQAAILGRFAAAEKRLADRIDAAADRVIGRLEPSVSALQEGQTRIMASQDALQKGQEQIGADVRAIVDRAIDEARRNGRLVEQVHSLSRDNEDLKQQLAAALHRAGSLAEKGDTQAREAIRQAREEHDFERLELLLRNEQSRREEQVKTEAADYFELCRELAAVALVRGDIQQAARQLETVLRFLPDDRHALTQRGRIHRLLGEPEMAETIYARVLSLSGDHPGWRAAAHGNLGLIYRARGDLDQAEAMHRKSLAINEKLGRLEGIAN